MSPTRATSTVVSCPWAESGMHVAGSLGVDPARGLSSPEAAERLRVNGPNELPREPPRSLPRSILAELRETMIVVLLVAAVLTALTGDFTDCAVILLVIAVNTAVGVVQERRALGAMVALRDLATPSAMVLRDGRSRRTDSRELVVGDVLRLAEGDVVGADARLIAAHELQVDESLLTGESMPALRDPDVDCPTTAAVGDRPSMVHAGTLVVHGTGSAVVVAVASDSELGHIAALLREHPAPATPLQRRLRALGRRLSLLVGLGCVLVVLFGVLRGQPWELMVLTGISLAVAAIPESLPAVVALALAGGTRRMAARGAIVRSLPAVEALGSVTLLALDKTGTLTTGSTECVALWTPKGGERRVDGRAPEGPSLLDEPTGGGVRALWEAVVLCSDAEPGAAGTEGAMVSAASAAGVDVAALRLAAPRVREVPFDSVRRAMLTAHATSHGAIEVSKGAPEVLLTGALADAEAARVVERWSRQAHRVLAVTLRSSGTSRLLGLIAIADPIRADARAAVLAVRAAGVTPVMITGDHPGTAEAVAMATGVIDQEDVTAGQPRSVYPRTDPAGKLDLVTAWQGSGQVVAMTGDGVNDAPALRAADVGVAMGRHGTDVARQAADLVLTDDSLHTLIVAVGEGRRVFDNIRRFVRYGLAGGLAEVMVMLTGPFLGFALPLLPAQILWVNLITHGLPGVAMGSEQPEPDVLTRPPRPPDEGLLTRRTVIEIVVLGTSITLGCLVLAGWAAAHGQSWQSMLFTTLVVAQLGIALTTRSRRLAVWRMSVRGNPFLYASVATSAVALLAALYLPLLSRLLGTTALTISELSLACAAGALPAAVIEISKALGRRAMARSSKGNAHVCA